MDSFVLGDALTVSVVTSFEDEPRFSCSFPGCMVRCVRPLGSGVLSLEHAGMDSLVLDDALIVSGVASLDGVDPGLSGGFPGCPGCPAVFRCEDGSGVPDWLRFLLTSVVACCISLAGRLGSPAPCLGA